MNNLDDDYYFVKINSVSLNTSGQIEIGQEVEVIVNYTLNCSNNYILSQNWVDLTNDPLSRSNLVHPVSNYIYKEIFSIDPDRFDPDYEKNYSAICDIEHMTLNGSLFGITGISEEKLKIIKANLKNLLISDIPELIFSNEKLNLTFNFFNENNKDFVLKNQNINVKLYDSESHLVQNFSKLTDDKGNLNITLDFKLGTPGIFNLYLNALNLNDYNDFYDHRVLNVLNINSSFNVIIQNETNLYVSTDFDNRSTKILLVSNYEGIFKWNSSFASGNFQEFNSSLEFETCLNNPNVSGEYYVEILGDLLNYNKTVKIPFTINFQKRNLTMTNFSMYMNNRKEIKIYQKFFDNLTHFVDNYKFNTEFYIYNMGKWNFICSNNNDKGEIYSIINLNDYSGMLEEFLYFKLNISSNCYYFRDIIKNFSIPNFIVKFQDKMESSTKQLINIQLLKQDKTKFNNQPIKIYINDVFFVKLITDLDGNCSFELSTPSFNSIIQVELIFDNDETYIPYIYHFEVIIIPNEFNSFISNSGIIVSIFLILPFCFILVKNQKTKKKMSGLKI